MKYFKLLITFILLSTANQAGSQTPASLHVTITGKAKQAAILIPGFTCSGSVWDATVQQLSNRYTCHVITISGFGGMPATTDPHLKQWVADIATYIKTNHLEKAIIIGHSIGGGMAMMLAADYPDFVSKIVVVDALPCLGAVQNPSYKADANADCSGFVTRYTSMSDSALRAMQTRTSAMLCADSTMWPQLVDWSLQSDRKTMGQIYCEFMNTDLRDTIARIQCPALILLEPSFKIYDSAMQQQYAKLLHKEIAYARKGLHFIMYDDREWYLQQINNYLR